MKKTILLNVGLLLLTAGSCPGATRLVPSEYSTIQIAIDDCNDGDSVIIADGTYTGPGNRNIDFKGKAITVKSENGSEFTVIDCEGSVDNAQRGFCFLNGEDDDSILAGFTIKQGYAKNGGGIYCSGSNPKIANCTIIGNSAEAGGGIHCRLSNPKIENCTITNNVGGGIFCRYGSPTIRNCTISMNTGGGIGCSKSSPAIANCSINDNWALTSGGGIHCDDSSAIISSCAINGNIAKSGGGIDFYYGGGTTISNCTISENTAEDGGGIRCYRSSPTISNCIITDNMASHFGGGIGSKGNPTISNCTIIGNEAEYGGGMDFHYDSSPTINSSNISNNKASFSGGVRCEQGSYLTINNCTISGNLSKYEGGGIYNSRGLVRNCTITSNRSSCGGGIFSSAHVTITNCILWSNEGPKGPEIYLTYNSDACVSYSDVKGGQDDVYVNAECTVKWGPGNIDAAPCFVKPGYWDANGSPDDTSNDFWVDGDYHLLHTSPCIDAAADAGVHIDIEGNIQPFNFPGVDNNGKLPDFDMGAYGATALKGQLLILPRLIDHNSSDPDITAQLYFPQGPIKDQIDGDEPLLLYPVGIKAMDQYVRQGAQNTSIFAFFDRDELMKAVGEGTVGLMVLGHRAKKGQYFYGADTVRIIGR